MGTSEHANEPSGSFKRQGLTNKFLRVNKRSVCFVLSTSHPYLVTSEGLYTHPITGKS